MDLTGLLLRHAPVRPLLVSLPGATATRLAAERSMRRRGWRAARNPAEANLVALAGSGADDAVAAAWQQVPLPRAMVRLDDPREVDAQLSHGESVLRDVRAQRGGHGVDAQQGSTGPAAQPAMADRGADRDGLSLDQLHITLGPVLPDWPPGLVVHALIQGDVLQQVSVTSVGPEAAAAGAPRGSFWDEPWRRYSSGERVSVSVAAARTLARRLDSAARLLGLAGCEDAAMTARRLRDEALAERPAMSGRAGLAAKLETWARGVERSRILRWSLRGLGEVPEGHGGLAPCDAYARLRGWIDDARAAAARLADHQPLPSDAGCVSRWAHHPPACSAVLDALPWLLTGCELAGARIAIAGLDPDLEQLLPLSAAEPHA